MDWMSAACHPMSTGRYGATAKARGPSSTVINRGLTATSVAIGVSMPVLTEVSLRPIVCGSTCVPRCPDTGLRCRPLDTKREPPGVGVPAALHAFADTRSEEHTSELQQ